MRLLIEKAREYRKDRQLIAAFIDLKAAFDSIDRRCLWLILQAAGVPEKLIRLFKKLYDDAESCVQVNGRKTDFFPTNSGVRQGCVAAPELFNALMDYLMTTVVPVIDGLSLGQQVLKDLEYADDTTLLSANINAAIHALTTFHRQATKLGLEVSWQKTKLLQVGGNHHPDHVTIDDHEVSLVDSFVYLGSNVTNTGDLSAEVNRRRGLAANVMKMLWKPLWRQRGVSLFTKVRIYRACALGATVRRRNMGVDKITN